MMLRTDVVEALVEETRFSGVVRVDGPGGIELEWAFGLADRGHEIANRIDTRFGLASGTKSLTALAVVSLIADGSLTLETPARSLLGDDLPLIHDAVTIEQLLSHRSGIGDYLDESQLEDDNDYTMTVPVHRLATTEDYLAVLEGYPTAFAPGERFEYCNGGFVVLALIAERRSGVAFHDLVRERVCEPAGMSDTAFLRSDELPGDAALGYLAAEGLRTNILHLPVRGSGDGGIYSTARDIRALWEAVFAGRIVPDPWVAEMMRPRGEDPRAASRYGLGFWLHPTREIPSLEGADAGVSFRSSHDPASGVTTTVISNTTDGAWPIAELLERRLSS